MELDWTERYRPRTLDELEGNPAVVASLREWADSWASGTVQKAAMILDGPPGVGKTSAALALAAERGWAVVEMNASDTRNAQAVRSIADRGSQLDTFTDDGNFISSKLGGFKLIVIDEAEYLFGREDAGGGSAIMTTLRRTRQPIILLVNDYYELQRKYSGISSVAAHLRFMRVQKATVLRLLRKVCAAEGVKADAVALDIIAENSGGDLRSAVKDLQAMATGASELKAEDLLALSYRERTRSIFDLMEVVFHERGSKATGQMLSMVEETPETVALWVDENLPGQYVDPADLARGFDALSRADIFLTHVTRRQNYAFWGYANDMMTTGVSLAKAGRAGGRARLQFPSWLRKMSQTKEMRRTKRQICRKVGGHIHASTDYVDAEYYAPFRLLMRQSTRMQIGMTAALPLSEEELAFLLDRKVGSAHLRKVMEEAAKLSKRDVQAPTMQGFDEAGAEPEKPEKPAEKVTQQKGLFDF